MFYFRALDKNEYNHITATYFLLAERKLKAHRLEAAGLRRPEHLSVTSDSKGGQTKQSDKIASNNNSETSSTMLTVPRTPGDLPQVRNINIYFYRGKVG